MEGDEVGAMEGDEVGAMEGDEVAIEILERTLSTQT